MQRVHFRRTSEPVFSTGGDPVALGLVASLNRPGANLTGSAVLETELAPKRLQLFREWIPSAAVFGVLADPAFPGTQSVIADLQGSMVLVGQGRINAVPIEARLNDEHGRTGTAQGHARAFEPSRPR
jgi:hypothetical protein